MNYGIRNSHDIYRKGIGTFVVEDASVNDGNSTTCAKVSAVLTGDTVQILIFPRSSSPTISPTLLRTSSNTTTHVKFASA